MDQGRSLLDGFFRFCLDNKLVVLLLTLAVAVAGLVFAPFDWNTRALPRDPVAVDAIPDIGENQQIVFTRWPGRSPQDVEDQITYPLTTALLGVPQVEDVRSLSMFGFSSIYIIFDEDAGFYWSRSRILEKLNSLSADTLPDGVQPTLGPDATALGQVFWYTLEGRDPDGRPTGGWDLDELRSLQDWTVRYALQAAAGVAEVASVGGFVREYQIDVDPDALQAHGVDLHQVFAAVRGSNIDVGARTIEISKAEYVIRSRGFIESPQDIADTVVTVRDEVPIYIRNLATVHTGPALRRGVLDKGGAEAVGGVVVVRHGANPLQAIKHIKQEIARIAPSLPQRAVIDFDRVDRPTTEAFAAAQGFVAFRDGALHEPAWREWLVHTPREQWPAWATLSQVTVVPFYDRTGLIHETLGTLEEALTLEILVTVIVVVLMVMHLRSSLLISGLLPLAVLMTFIAMKGFGVDANIVALSGIAIAIGTMVDMGVVLCENILRHLDAADEGAERKEVVFAAVSEVGGAVLTAVLTTVISFLPVFAMTGSEGKLFTPLAYTKTFALIASIIVAFTIIPPLAHLLFVRRIPARALRVALGVLTVLAGVVLGLVISWWLALAVVVAGIYHLVRELAGAHLSAVLRRHAARAFNYLLALALALVLAQAWLPLGPAAGLANQVFVIVLIGGLFALFALFHRVYVPLLRFFLDHKWVFVPLPLLICAAGLWIWRGMGREFMPPLDEGSFLLMPTTMTHASIGEARDVVAKQDMAISAIPEVESAVGKIGRVESPLDPAPISMVETVITYRSEYAQDAAGHHLRFAWDQSAGQWVRKPGMEDEPLPHEGGELPATAILQPDPKGRVYRQWRPHIADPDDIWAAIRDAARIPGTTTAPKLQPIAARIVMLATGMRAPIGIKVFGPDLETIEGFGLRLEQLLKDGTVAGIAPATVYAERVIGKPYLEIDLDRRAAARHGIRIADAQQAIQVAVGGIPITTTVEGRERYAVRVRYARERRDSIEDLERILIPGAGARQIPLGQISAIDYVRGPQVIKSEDTRLVSYVTFDIRSGYAEVDVVESAQAYLARLEAAGELGRPEGAHYAFAGNYENQLRARRTLSWTVPLALLLIFLILYLQFRSVATTVLVFSGVFVAWAGGFIMLWLYGQPWFLDLSLAGRNLRDLFQMGPVNLSVAVWVGFLALFGIATDDGVLFSTYIRQRLAAECPADRQAIRASIVAAAAKRIRPALMTSATTILALIPVLTATGRGADVMIPMAIPTFGGMVVVMVSVFVVPVFSAWMVEARLRLTGRRGALGQEGKTAAEAMASG